MTLMDHLKSSEKVFIYRAQSELCCQRRVRKQQYQQDLKQEQEKFLCSICNPYVNTKKTWQGYSLSHLFMKGKKKRNGTKVSRLTNSSPEQYLPLWINILKIVLKVQTGYQHLAESLRCLFCNTGCNTEINIRGQSFLWHRWKLFLFPGIISRFKIVTSILVMRCLLRRIVLFLWRYGLGHTWKIPLVLIHCHHCNCTCIYS